MVTIESVQACKPARFKVKVKDAAGRLGWCGPENNRLEIKVYSTVVPAGQLVGRHDRLD